MESHPFEQADKRLTVQPALDYLHSFSVSPPEVAIILGSGLSQFADSVHISATIPTRDIPGYPVSTAPGHKGQLIFGTFENRNVVLVQGRIHAYEGYTACEVAFPVRLASSLGATHLIVTNAAGGIERSWTPGTLMLIRDHINMTFDHPLRGPRSTLYAIDPPSPSPYDHDWLSRVKKAAHIKGISVKEGVYLWTKGPSYETKAEIQAFDRIGANAVGMSTVPEVIQAHQLDMSVLGVSTITNYAAGLGTEELKHEDVLMVGQQIQTTLKQLLRIILHNI